MLLSKILFTAALVTLSSMLAAETYVKGSSTKIKQIISYNVDVVAGDVLFRVEHPTVGCESGFFIPASNGGLSNSLSVALSAFHAGSSVKVHAYSGVSWAASNKSDYCRVHAIELIR